MLLLLAFAFLAGIVTILSPCILPILPVILSGSVATGKKRPWGIITGFILSFTFFTLFLSLIVQATGVSPSIVRYLAVATIFLFGITLVVPQIQLYFEKLFSFFSKFAPKTNKLNNGFSGGLVIGFSLGLVWTPCVGPILASVISLALVGEVNSLAFFITLAYATGTAIPMLLITYFGQNLFQKIPWLLKNTSQIQRGFGLIMILVAVGIYFNIDRKFQTFILTTFPSYGQGLTQFEDNQFVRNQLDRLQGKTKSPMNLGRDTYELNPENYPLAPEIIPGGQWFNSEPFILADKKGSVVLVDFWTYSCINCIRTLPYLQDWHQKYGDQGLTILGVHSPEFEFEKDPQNLKTAINDFGLTYPIVQDNNFATWRAYQNRYWPAKYLIDRNGRIRYTHFGEGEYAETEELIQLLLAESGSDVSQVDINNSDYQIYSRTPELYLGLKRIEYLASSQTPKQDQILNFSHPNNLPQNFFSFAGDWTVSSEYSQPDPNASLKLKFESKEVFLVMRSESGDPIEVSILLDGELVEESIAGMDVYQSKVTVSRDRLYSLIKLAQPGIHILELQFKQPGVQVFAFTFG